MVLVVPSTLNIQMKNTINGFRKNDKVYSKTGFYKVKVEHIVALNNRFTNSSLSLENNVSTINIISLRSKSRGSEKIQLPFRFPFYSSYLSSVYITTEGFLSMSNFLHSGMHQYAYVAPLLANLYRVHKAEKSRA